MFRLLTIASSGIGSFILGLWGLKFGFGDGLAGMQTGTMIGIIAALCALASAGAALSFFAGVDESADYVFKETHFDKLTGLLARPAMVGRIADAASATMKTGEPVFLSVETENQATLLRAAGCEVVQGFLYGRPAPLELGETQAIHDIRERRVANLH
ncbi:hypothetical protein MESS2_1030084 [Mesorhizobium metallidurans STM 2683]|uniref:EAL domain-containing protein n=1 Tax=Mesorhizobium metallidurans STM 2683 TaxID=1297569 RepID=M5EFU6_9HYPH|nr:hypothetical protein MESS2_1030084 [Mesorhizobium metallidurans STM 2683]